MESSTSAVDLDDGFPAFGDTERFLTSLSSAPSPLNFNLSTFPEELNALPFEMPLAHALAADTPNLTSPTLPIPNNLELPLVKPELDPPVSALTAASLVSSASTVLRNGRISKKKARTPNVTAIAPAAAAALAASLSNQNLSVASDVSSNPLSVSSPDSNSASTDLDWSTAKAEPQAHSPSKPSARNAPHPPRNSTPCINDLSPEPPKSHTRRCREKVTRQFENLLQVLPPPPRGVEVRHKAQILDYTISVFQRLLARRTSLQTHIALASNQSVRDWANSTMAKALALLKSNPASDPPSISSLADPFMRFYCVKNSWAYAETWITSYESTHASLRSCFVNAQHSHLSNTLNAFASSSKARYQSPCSVVTGIISRVRQTRRPEWLSDLPSDQSVFDRAGVARKSNVNVALAIPVIAANKCLAVMLFADVTSKPYSAHAVDQVFQYASILAESFVQHSRGAPSMQQPTVAITCGGQLVLNPGVSMDAESGLQAFANAEADICTPHGWPSAALMIPQATQGSPKSFLEESQLVRMKY